MMMAKATEKDMDAALLLQGILMDVATKQYPRGIDGEFDENAPEYFDPNNEEHLRIFYDRIMAAFNLSPGGIGRVIWGFHTIMHNDIVNPDSDVLELHPRLVKVLEELSSKKEKTLRKKPKPQDCEKEIYEALTIQALRMRNEIYAGDPFSKEQFTATYLDGLGEYERELARREEIEI